jgi:uncharacterized membrane protein
VAFFPAGIYDARADPGNCDYREVQEGDPPDHPIGMCSGQTHKDDIDAAACPVFCFSFLVSRSSFLVPRFWFLVSGFLFLVKTNHLPDNVVVFWNAFACVYCTGCLGMFDGWGAKMPFVWAALLYLCTATFCWHTAIRNGVRTKTTRLF